MVVFRQPIAAGQGAGFNLAAVYTDDKISYKRVFGFSGTVRYHGRISDLIGQFDTIQGFGEGSDLVQLYQDRICHAQFDAFAEYFGIGHEDIVAHKLNGPFQSIRHCFPALPVAFGQTILDGKNRVIADEFIVIIDHFGSRQILLFRL